MILPWIAQLGLLKSNEDKNILRDFPLSVKRVVVSEIVKYVAKKYSEAIKLLTTPAHVNFIMEIIGQSFQLPIQDHEVINMAIDIYHKWLFSRERPQPIIEDTQTFIREIFRHFSFLFVQREGQTNSVLKDHIYLCNRVLDIFLQMGMHGDMMDETSWNHILLIILGITDSTLRGKKGLTELNYGMLKVLFELWLCSLSYDKQMWSHLQTHAIQWGKHMATIKQWNAVCFALTQRVVNLLYGPTEGTPVVRIQWKGLNPTNNPNPNVGNPVTELDLPDEYVYFSWNLMLHIIGNPNKLLDPEIHLKAFLGLQNITKMLAYVGKTPLTDAVKQKEGKEWYRLPYAPDGNSILEIFGPWYFEAVNRKLNVFNEGRAVAYSALCRIYCRKGGNAFTKENLALFYHAIINGLEEDELVVVSQILANSCRIFSYELEGSHILIPHYIKSIEKILQVPKTKHNPYPASLRSACITLLSSLICLPNHFAGSENSEKNEIYSGLKVKIADILDKALACEKSPKNLNHLMWCIVVFIYEEIDFNPSIANNFIKSMLHMLKKYGANPPKEFTSDVFSTIFEALSSVTSLYPKLEKDDPTIALQVVDQIAMYIPIQMNVFSTKEAVGQLIADSFYCMCDWLMCAYEKVFSDKDVISRVLSAIEICLDVEKLIKQRGPIVDEVKGAAEYTLCHMLNFVGNFPPTNDISAQSSSIVLEDPECFDRVPAHLSKYARYFMFDDLFIFCVIEQPDEKMGPGVTVLVRDVTGKFAWDSRLLYGPKEKSSNEILQSGQYTGSTADELTGHTEEAETNKILMKFSQPPTLKERPDLDKFAALIDEQEKAENAEYKKKFEQLKTMDISLKPPKLKSKYDSDNKFQMSRLLLSHLGFFNLGLTNRKRFYQLQINQKLIRSIRMLDITPERECHKIGVIYIKEGQDLQQEILKNEEGSERFQQFVSSLGWNVSVADHTGFLGGLDRKTLSTGKEADRKSVV